MQTVLWAFPVPESIIRRKRKPLSVDEQKTLDPSTVDVMKDKNREIKK